MTDETGKPTVILIDDDEVDRMACRRALAQHQSDLRLLEAELGQAGIELAIAERAEIVLLDYRLPDVDGLVVLEHLMAPDAIPGGPAPSVIMMTGVRELETAVEAMRLGARDYLLKDAEKKYLELLPQALDRILEERMLRQHMREAEEALRRANAELEGRVHARTAELHAEREQAMITLTAIADAVLVLDPEGRVAQMNPAAERMTGESADALVGELLCERLAIRDEGSGRALRNAAELSANGREGLPLRLERRDGTELIVTVSGGKMHDSDGRFVGIVSVLHDISEEHARAQALIYQATHDTLTSLPNRHLFLDRLSQSLNHASHSNEKLAVVFLDLDGFKGVNDRFGHHVGDHLLQSVADRLQSCIRESDSLARLAGDEFTLAVSGKSADRGVQVVANKVIAQLTAPFDIDGNQIRIGTSVGISIYPDDGDSVEELLEKADSAMYRAKTQGGSAYRYYSPH